MTTQDKNAEIALWMGFKRVENEKNIFTLENRIFVTNELKYHSDWNWLMPVLIKMSQVERGRFIYELRDDRIEIWDWALREKEGAFNYYSTFYGKSQNYDIMGGIHEAVYQFVVWHNQQQKL